MLALQMNAAHEGKGGYLTALYGIEMQVGSQLGKIVQTY
jgi:hypothetical protein